MNKLCKNKEGHQAKMIKCIYTYVNYLNKIMFKLELGTAQNEKQTKIKI